MKCEICKKADAATVMHRKKKDGSDEELYVCKACAAKGAGKPHSKGDKAKEATKVTVDGENPPTFVENFVKAALGLVEGFAEQEKDKRECPGCGRHEGDGNPNFERIRRIPGYLVGTLESFNDAKRAEEHDRVKHQV